MLESVKLCQFDQVHTLTTGFN